MPSLSPRMARAPKVAKVLRALLPTRKEDRDEAVINEEDVNPRVLKIVCDGLLAGQVGIIPTETVYGLMGDAGNDAVIERIYAIKERDRDKPLPVQVFRFSDVAALGVSCNASAELLARNFWPGPLTLVLPFLGAAHCRVNIAPTLLRQWEEAKTVAVRIPEHTVTRMVLETVRIPLVATSANISGQEPITRLSQLDETLPRKVDWIVDGGTTVFGRESTVVRCDEEGWRILREGALRGVILQKAFGAARG